MDTLTSIKVFRQVIDCGGFARAADRLEMSTAMVSKHIMSVEQRLGERLINRNSRSLSLTEPGRLYFQCCQSMIPRGLALLAAIDKVSRCHGVTFAQVALAWLMCRRSVTAPIASATSLAQLREITKSVELELTIEDLRELDL